MQPHTLQLHTMWGTSLCAGQVDSFLNEMQHDYWMDICTAVRAATTEVEVVDEKDLSWGSMKVFADRSKHEGDHGQTDSQ